MKRSEVVKRYILFIIGLFFMGIGVAFTKKAGLGVSPISSVPNFLSLKLPFFTIGNWLIVWNCLMIIGQIIILRKNFKLIQFLQIPFSFVFGYFTDFGMWCLSPITSEVYALRITMVILGVVILGFGISLTVIANVVMNSGEAFVKAIADTIKKDFGNVKIIFDISNVLLSVILSLIFFNFTIQGAREGTVIAALFTGLTVKLFNSRLKCINKLLIK